jgi:hypothetical protein
MSNEQKSARADNSGGAQMTTMTLNGLTYVWRMEDAPETLYGVAVDPDSLTPDGLTLTLRNRQGGTETIRGEMHGAEIVFMRITGHIVGRWSPQAKASRVPVRYHLILPLEEEVTVDVPAVEVTATFAPQTRRPFTDEERARLKADWNAWCDRRETTK